MPCKSYSRPPSCRSAIPVLSKALPPPPVQPLTFQPPSFLSSFNPTAHPRTAPSARPRLPNTRVRFLNGPRKRHPLLSYKGEDAPNSWPRPSRGTRGCPRRAHICTCPAGLSYSFVDFSCNVCTTAMPFMQSSCSTRSTDGPGSPSSSSHPSPTQR